MFLMFLDIDCAEGKTDIHFVHIYGYSVIAVMFLQIGTFLSYKITNYSVVTTSFYLTYKTVSVFLPWSFKCRPFSDVSWI